MHFSLACISCAPPPPFPQLKVSSSAYSMHKVVQKGYIKKGFSKNSWKKGKLQNRHRARWAKGKTGIARARRAYSCTYMRLDQYIHIAIDGV